MNTVKASRLKELEDLKNFSDNIDEELDKIIESVSWSTQSIENFKPLIQCPFDSSHQISEKSLEEHLERCQWKAEGYDDTCVALSSPSVPPNASSCITFDEQLLEEVLQQAKSTNPSLQIGAGNRLIPRTADRLMSDFTADERKAIYEYSVNKTVKPDVVEEIADLNKQNNESKEKSTSYLELLAQERNLKRRRAKHRGVHTNKKSQIEILREIINQQMEMLEEYIADQTASMKKKDILMSKEKKDENSELKKKMNTNIDESKIRDTEDIKDFKTKKSDERRRKEENYDRERFASNDNHESDHRDHRRHHHRSHRSNNHHRTSSATHKKQDEHSKYSHKSSRSHEGRDKYRHRDNSEDRKHKRDYDGSAKYYSKHSAHDESSRRHRHKKHEQHSQHRSGKRDSSDYSCADSNYESDRSKKR